MNKPRLPRSRPVCSLVRRWEAGFGPGTGEGRLAARHLAACAECREFFAEDPGFEQMLRRDATRLRELPADSGLERRILRAVREADPAAARGFHQEISPVWRRALLTSAGLAAALAFVFWPRSLENRPDAPALAVKEATAAPEVVAPRVAAAAESRDWWQALKARKPDLAWAEKNPLEQEIDSVRTDARAVVGFLALNFLPSKPRPDSPPSQG